MGSGGGNSERWARALGIPRAAGIACMVVGRVAGGFIDGATMLMGALDVMVSAEVASGG